MESYRYPSDLGGKQNDNTRCVSFMAIKSLKMFNDNDGITKLDKIEEGEAEMLIYLPTPLNLTDTQSHSWSQETTISAFEKISQAVGGALSKISTNFGVLGNTAGSLISSVTNAAASGATGMFTIAANLGKAPVVGLMSLMSNQRKALVNPGYFQNYTQSTPRTFEFSYTFYARNQDEALEVLNIIRSFKMYSSPVGDNNSEFKKQQEGTISKLNFATEDSGNNVGTTVDVGTFNQSSPVPDEPSGGTDLSGTEFTAGFVSKVNEGMANIFGYMGQPNYWRISFGNDYLNRLLGLDYVVCTSVGVTYGNGSKLEMYKDGIPKVITLSLSFAEVKLKMREDFSKAFTRGDTNKNDNFNKSFQSNQAPGQAPGPTGTPIAEQVKYNYRVWEG